MNLTKYRMIIYLLYALHCSYIFAAYGTKHIRVDLSTRPISTDKSFIEVVDNEYKAMTKDKKGFFTKGVGPCLAIMVYEDSTLQPLAMMHYAPVDSTASLEDAHRSLQDHLETLLYQAEVLLGFEFEEEEEKHPLYDLVSIVIVGGQESSIKSIEAVKKIHRTQYFPVTNSYLNETGNDKYFDVLFTEGRISIYETPSS